VYAVYTALLAAGFVLAFPFYLWKGRATGKYKASFRERMGSLPAALQRGPSRSIWVHAVSVGEVLTARVLVDGLKRRFPGWSVFLSTTTVTGHEVARRSVPTADGLFYAPFDFPGPVRTALTRLDPALLVLVETEIWPNLIHEARRRGTRVAIVNGRLSPRSFPRYRRLGGWLRRVLGDVDLFLMQGEPHAERARALGAPDARVRVTGNLKFDALPEPGTAPALLALLRGEGPLWVAGSTAPGEEAVVLEAFRSVRAQVPGLRLLLAPRHAERFGEAVEIARTAGFQTVRRTELQDGWRGEVVILDTLGELSRVYALGTVVFVGGSLVPSGGHNVLEAAAAGKPVIVGPHMENFQEIADQFLAADALVQVRDAAGLAPAVLRLLTHPAEASAVASRAYGLVEGSRGALQSTVDALAELVA
jgi:3-deoxy-D-manno-octulosonic-acid transferase